MSSDGIGLDWWSTVRGAAVAAAALLAAGGLRPTDSLATGGNQQPAAESRQPTQLEPTAAKPARAADQQGEQDRALRIEQLDAAKRLVTTLPDSDNALHLTALVYREQGDVEEAVKYCRKTLQLNPPPPKERRAEAYEVMGHIALLQGDYQQAVELSRKALAINPPSAGNTMPGVALRVAQALIRLGKMPEAVSALEKDIQVSPQASLSYRTLGECHLQMQEYEKAQRYFETAIAIRPDLAEAYYGLATVSARLGQMDKAGQYRRKFQTLAAEKQEVGRRQRSEFDPLKITRRSVAHTHTDVGRVYQRHGYVWTAEKLWRRAAELDPQNTACRWQLASIYRQNNKPREALALHEQINAIEPDNALNHLAIGVLSRQLKRTEAAAAAFQKVIELAPSRAEGHHALARLYLQTGQKLAPAQTLAAKAVELDPIAPNYFLLGQICAHNGDSKGSRAAFEHAVRLDPNNAAYQQALRQPESTK